jgi:hypothetical protein
MEILTSMVFVLVRASKRKDPLGPVKLEISARRVRSWADAAVDAIFSRTSHIRCRTAAQTFGHTVKV